MTSLKLGGESRAVLTRLGRAIHTTHGTASPDTAPHREEHRHVNWLRDVILGGQDGLVNILGMRLGHMPEMTRRESDDQVRARAHKSPPQGRQGRNSS